MPVCDDGNYTAEDQDDKALPVTSPKRFEFMIHFQRERGLDPTLGLKEMELMASVHRLLSQKRAQFCSFFMRF